MRHAAVSIPVLSFFILTACASVPGKSARPEAPPAPLTPTELFAGRSSVLETPVEIRLAPRTDGLSVAQSSALDQLMMNWIDTGAGEIVIQESPGSERTARAAHGHLLMRGVPTGALRLVPAATAGPVVVGYLGRQVETPTCGNFGDLSKIGSNQPHANFGCAVSANMAHQIADPQDLLYPRTQTPADAARRLSVLDAYRRGQDSATERSDQSSGAISKVVP